MPIAVDRQSIRDAIVSAADRVFGEWVELIFYKDEYRPDPDRPKTRAFGVLRVGGVDDTTLAGGKTEEWRTRIAAGEAELTIDIRSYDGPDIRANDYVVAVDRRFRPEFKLKRKPDFRGETRMVLKLTEA